MIVTERFVFLHLHKSGGTFVNRLLLDFFPDTIRVGYHLPHSHIPARFRSLPILGTVRNPWDYYVSWYFFQLARPNPNPLFAEASKNKTLGCQATISNLVSLSNRPDAIGRVRDRLPTAFTGRGINLTASCLEPLSASGLGFYSFLYRRMFGPAHNTTLIPMEDLGKGLLAHFDGRQIDLSAQARAFLEGNAILNGSDHGHYSEYYDEELKQLVAVMDGELIARHGYRF